VKGEMGKGEPFFTRVQEKLETPPPRGAAQKRKGASPQKGGGEGVVDRECISPPPQRGERIYKRAPTKERCSPKMGGGDIKSMIVSRGGGPLFC